MDVLNGISLINLTKVNTFVKSLCLSNNSLFPASHINKASTANTHAHTHSPVLEMSHFP